MNSSSFHRLPKLALPVGLIVALWLIFSFVNVSTRIILPRDAEHQDFDLPKVNFSSITASAGAQSNNILTVNEQNKLPPAQIPPSDDRNTTNIDSTLEEQAFQNQLAFVKERSKKKNKKMTEEFRETLTQKVTYKHAAMHKYWNFSSQKLELPEDVASMHDEPTSFAILQKFLEDYPPGVSIDRSDSCFRAQADKTAALAEKVAKGAEPYLSLPLLNVGMSKMGSSTL